MSSIQKVIKYLAIAFGLFLSVNIIAAIAVGVLSLVTVISGKDIINSNINEGNNATANWMVFDISKIKDLNIDIGASNIVIKSNSLLSEEERNDKAITVDVTNISKGCKIESKDNTLYIKDSDDGFKFYDFAYSDNILITMYIPDNFKFEKVILNAGVGNGDINKLYAENMEIELGVGDYTFSDILVKEAKVSGGVGNVEIFNSEFDKLNLNTGVGNFEVNAKITKEADVDCGVGNLEFYVLDDFLNYKVIAQTGLGNFKLNGEKVSNNNIYGTGDICIKVNSGMGDTNINFNN